MILVFVHGWSVTDTATYGLVPEALAEQAGNYGLSIEVKHLWLGRYISFHDEVSVADISRAFDRALRDVIPDDHQGISKFSCITHSTGGPVVRDWLNRFYGSDNISASPLEHLVMLAPANHGSSLAALGKKRVGRIKAWFAGVEPGQRVLDWLCLGSNQEIELARDFLDYRFKDTGFYPFVLTGETIDKKFYDFLNSYLTEAGSDGVIRVAGANMNFSMIRLKEVGGMIRKQHGPEELDLHLLQVDGGVRRPELVAMGVIPDASHSGSDMGIMASVLSKESSKPQVSEILKCLKVDNFGGYEQRTGELSELTKNCQSGKDRYSMLVFIVKDDQGDPINDFDLILLAGENYEPDKISKGFFVDRQKNSQNQNHLIYYINYDVIVQNKITGFRIIARPSSGFAFYHAVEFHSTDEILDNALKPNETIYVEIILKRCVDKNTLRLDECDAFPLEDDSSLLVKKYTRDDFKKIKPLDEEID